MEEYVDLVMGGRIVGRELKSDGSGVPILKNSYPLDEFIEFLSDDEFDAVKTLVGGNKQASRFWEYTKAKGSIDFNENKPVQFLSVLVANSVDWEQARADLIIG